MMKKIIYTATFEGPRQQPGQIAMGNLSKIRVEVEVYKVGTSWTARAKATRGQFPSVTSPSSDAARKSVAGLFQRKVSEWKATDPDGFEVTQEEIEAADRGSRSTHTPTAPETVGDRKANPMSLHRAICGKRVCAMDLAEPDDMPTCQMCLKTLRKAAAAAVQPEQKPL